MQSTIDKVIECIQKPVGQRHDKEVNEFVPWFAKLNDQFSKLKPEVICDILKNCEFAIRPRDFIIIRQFDTGDCFYIILSGKASIFINTDSVPDDPDENTTVDLGLDEPLTDNKKEKKELDRSKFGIFVGCKVAGTSFGELALINKNSKRNASIIADEMCRLLVVNRDLYNRSLRSIQEAEFRQRIDFVNGCSLFDNWLSRYKRQAAMSLRKESYEFNMYLAQQGKPLNGLVFILNGQAKVVVDTLMHFTQYPELRLDEDPEEIEKRESTYAEIGDRLLDVKTESKKLWEMPIRRLGYAAVEQRQAQRHLEVALVGPGETVGDIEQGMELSTYAQSIICTEHTEVYIIDSKNYERLMSPKRNPRSLQLLKRRSEVKVMNRVARSFQKTIPLLRTLVFRIMEEEKQEMQKELLLKAPPIRSQSAHGSASDFDAFIPQRGPLIDLYGPGTVFYRNRMLRLEKIKAAKVKAQAQAGSSRTPGMVLFAAFGESENKLENGEGLTMRQYLLQTVKEVNESIENKPKDWETSSQHLNTLEARLNEWYTAVDDMEERKHKEVVFKLKRFAGDQDLGKRVPGCKVLLRPKQPPAPLDPNDEEATVRCLLDPPSTPIKSKTAAVFITAPEIRPDEITAVRMENKGLRLIENINTQNNTQNAVQKPPKPKSAPAQEKVRKKQYTKQEYQDLKQLLKKKERELMTLTSTLCR